MSKVGFSCFFILFFLYPFLIAQERETTLILKLKFEKSYEDLLNNKKFPKLSDENEELELKNKIKNFPENYSESVKVSPFPKGLIWYFYWNNREYYMEKSENYLIIYEVFFGVDKSISLKELPSYATQEEGKITLFVDYNNVKKNELTIYLINKTSEHVVLRCEDNNIYLKLEAKNENNNWERAESHGFSWCGNSYYSFRIKSGTFTRFQKHSLSEGEIRHVRYRIYNQDDFDIISNIGEGKISLEEIEIARYDNLAIRCMSDLEILKKIIEKKITPALLDHTNPIHQALWRLRYLENKKQSENYLNELLNNPEFQKSEYFEEARNVLETILKAEKK